MISQKEEMRTETESSGLVLHDNIIERIFFTLSFSHKKEMGSEKLMAEVVLPVQFHIQRHARIPIVATL
jgi:hypothetical protein